MKSCPLCTLQFEDEFLFCAADGAMLVDTSPSSSQGVSPATSSISPDTSESVETADGEAIPTASPAVERPSHRVAAQATAIALVLFALAASYKLYASMSRPARMTNATQAAPEQADLFVPTPPAARDFVEEPERTVLPGGRETETRSTASPGRVGPRSTRDDRDLEAPTTGAPSPPSASPPPPDFQQTAAARVTLSLVRIRARRTADGYQYDLTFDAQEQTGRPVLWKQLSLTTRSASGLNRSQMLPFSRRLDRAGSLTFTVSAAMPGSAESDWRGRIICSSFGVDDTSKVVRATLATDVSPR